MVTSRTPGTSTTGSVTETPSVGATQRTTVVVVAPRGSSVSSGVDVCTGSGPYAALKRGTVVRVVDASGALITSVPLGTGRPSGQADGCTWSAEVELPTNRGSCRAVIEGWGSSGLLSPADLYQPITIQPTG
ncbi:hypothetical protein N865_01345 [Intrasporangium oryzae NRRL B-24470]|uniref:Uncharacterized protein n=1 Tax=Intrasporangium oryzae NRRL B-24470 TaxID=1386089 RepID=W9G484_9MICO|nr:hypothetical protein N865_01345 [Intrasporangium oryzae NRRL B-24470]